MKKFAVILSGSGVYDGSEIHEVVLTLLAIAKQNAKYVLFAPDMEQHHVVNHLNGEEMKEKRNVLVEAARIARGDIQDLTTFDSKEFDAVVFPGGFGVAKNLSDFAFKGAKCKVHSEVERVIKETYVAKKTIGALCISPAIIARVLKGVDVTIGQDEATAKIIEEMGAKHINTLQTDVVVDKINKVITTPCYMLDANIVQIAEGADNMVKAMLDIIE